MWARAVNSSVLLSRADMTAFAVVDRAGIWNHSSWHETSTVADGGMLDRVGKTYRHTCLRVSRNMADR